jgi:hypothetical protein
MHFPWIDGYQVAADRLHRAASAPGSLRAARYQPDAELVMRMACKRSAGARVDRSDCAVVERSNMKDITGHGASCVVSAATQQEGPLSGVTARALDDRLWSVGGGQLQMLPQTPRTVADPGESARNMSRILHRSSHRARTLRAARLSRCRRRA